MTASPRSHPLARVAIVGGLLLAVALPGLAESSHFRPRPGIQTPRLTAAGTYASPDDALVAARHAALRGDTAELADAVKQIPESHPLRMYADYWTLRAQLADPASTVTDAQVRRVMERHAGSLVSDLARRDWLAALGRRQAWATLRAEAQALRPPIDAALQCLILQARLAEGQTITEDARALLMAPRELSDDCQDLLNTLLERRLLNAADQAKRWERALEAGTEGAIRQALPLATPPVAKQAFDQAWRKPQATLKYPRSNSLAMVALTSLARSDPAEAANFLTRHPEVLATVHHPWMWSQIALRGMQKALSEAHAWGLKARTANPADETLAALARAALRAQDWRAVRTTIERMTPAGRQDPTWVYWLGRALHTETAQPEAQHRARVLWTSLAGQPHFYGQLATEELGLPHRIPPKPAPLTPAELTAAQNHPGLARAFYFYDLGLRPEGQREWTFHVRDMTDRELLASAELARQRGLLDRTVHAAERTREQHDFALRYPAPFADRLEPIAREQGLDPAWIYGLIRQESRFVMDARSTVGAAGLMQIMPATGRWIARKLGQREFTPQQLHDLDTNLQFGTFYLRTIFDKLERSPVLASAGYNAGPGRPRAWQGSLSQPVEGAIFAETIPFTETRGYVKHVISNTVWYATLFSQRPQSIKAWLGTIAPASARPAVASPDGEYHPLRACLPVQLSGQWGNPHTGPALSPHRKPHAALLGYCAGCD